MFSARFGGWPLPQSVFLSALALAILSELAIGNAQNVDFNQCWNEIVSQLNASDTNDANQCFMWDKTHRHRINTDRPYLTLSGCKSLCGSGYQLWPSGETLRRLAYFILPLVALAVRFAYAQVGIENTILIFVHLLGDPVDSLWSTLTRQEISRRNFHLATEIAPTAAQDVAAIWTAYDQWWQDPTKHFEEALVAGRRRRVREEPAQSSRSQRSDACHFVPSFVITILGFITKHTVKLFKSLGRKLWRDDPLREDVFVPKLLTQEQILRIKKASHHLANNREGRLLTSWFTIVLFLASLTAAYIRTATENINNQTAHTLAVVMLFSFLVFAVYISGYVGNFKDPKLVLAKVIKLSETNADLFPEVSFAGVSRNNDRDITSQYKKVAPLVGINNSWRPTKSLKQYGYSDRSRWTLFLICFEVLLVSWLTAFLLSYLTPAVGIGCRSFAWTMIAIAWLVSVAFDIGFRHLFESPQVLWCITLIKDGIIMFGSVAAVVAAQAGLMNTCFCRASAFFRKNRDSVCIDLGPVTDAAKISGWKEWLIIPICGLALILLGVFAAGYEGEHGRLLFHRTSAEMHAEWIAIKNMKAWVRPTGEQVSTDGEDPNHGQGPMEGRVSVHSQRSLHDQDSARGAAGTMFYQLPQDLHSDTPLVDHTNDIPMSRV